MSKIFIIEILFTWACNYDCPYCYLRPDRLHKEEEFTIREDKIKDLVKFIRVLENFLKKTKIIIWISGGEPMLASGLIKKFVNKVNKANIKNLYAYEIFTNNYLVDEELLNILKNTNKNLFLQISLHFENFKHDFFWKNLDIYLKYIDIFNIDFVYMADGPSLYSFYNNAMLFLNKLESFLKERYPEEIVRRYFSEITAHFFPRTDFNKIPALRKEEIDSFYEQFFKLFEYWGRKYNTELVFKVNPFNFNEKPEGYYCKIFSSVQQIRIYPNLYIDKCPSLPFYFIKNTPYFKKYTIYDVIKDPNIIRKNFLTEKGRLSAFLNGKITQRFVSLYSLPRISYCPVKSLHINLNQNKEIKMFPYTREDYIYHLISLFTYRKRGKIQEKWYGIE